MDAYQALEKLVAGNKRYVTERYAKTNAGSQKRFELTKGQQPFAAILSCSDSRTPPEIIFDQGLGDLFVVRTAGHVVDTAVLGSIEYAVELLEIRLLLILGHQDCGAVKATLTGAAMSFHINSITQAIAPAIELAKRSPGELLPNSIKANIDFAADKLRSMSPIISKAINSRGLQVIGATYNIEDGNVIFD